MVHKLSDLSYVAIARRWRSGGLLFAECYWKCPVFCNELQVNKVDGSFWVLGLQCCPSFNYFDDWMAHSLWLKALIHSEVLMWWVWCSALCPNRTVLCYSWFRSRSKSDRAVRTRLAVHGFVANCHPSFLRCGQNHWHRSALTGCSSADWVSLSACRWRAAGSVFFRTGCSVWWICFLPI